MLHRSRQAKEQSGWSRLYCDSDAGAGLEGLAVSVPVLEMGAQPGNLRQKLTYIKLRDAV